MIESPCIRVCCIESRNGLCAGCFRTLDEIMQWPEMTEMQRQEVVELANQRRPDSSA
jgi:predicted Fe-S protein YdhL (DUF1289 family)